MNFFEIYSEHVKRIIRNRIEKNLLGLTEDDITNIIKRYKPEYTKTMSSIGISKEDFERDYSACTSDILNSLAEEQREKNRMDIAGVLKQTEEELKIKYKNES